MTIGAQDIFSLFMEEGHERIILLIEAAPEGKLWLHDDAKFIGCHESSLWWAPGVEADMVDAIGIASAEVIAP